MWVAAGHGGDEVVGAAVGASGGSGDVGLAVAATTLSIEGTVSPAKA